MSDGELPETAGDWEYQQRLEDLDALLKQAGAIPTPNPHAVLAKLQEIRDQEGPDGPLAMAGFLSGLVLAAEQSSRAQLQIIVQLAKDVSRLQHQVSRLASLLAEGENQADDE